MIRIISEEHILPQELEILLWLLDSGLDFYHFRKRGIPQSELIAFLNQIPSNYRSQVVLHHHISLPGFLRHHNSAQRSLLSVNVHSCSVHEKIELFTYINQYQFVFWSPVFNSISKEGHLKNKSIQLSDVNDKLRNKLIALGGIEPSKFRLVKAMGFSHIALKGWFWNRKETYKQAWIEIQTTWQELEKKY